jgi:hypothetical protein
VDENESSEVLTQAVHVLENLMGCKRNNLDTVYKYSQENLMEERQKLQNERFQDNESIDISESIKEISFKSLEKQKLKNTLERNLTTKIIETKLEDSEHSRNSLGEEIEYDREEEIQRKIKELNQNETSFKKLNHHKNSLTNLAINRNELNNIIEEEEKRVENTRARNFSNKKSLRSFKQYSKPHIGIQNKHLLKNLDQLEDRPKGISLNQKGVYKNKSLESVSVKEPKLKDHNKIKDFDLKKVKYRVGEWVDALDTQNIWQEAQISKVEEGRVKVHFNEGNPENDKWIPLMSKRIGLFRSHTTGMEGSYFLSPVPSKKVQMRLANISKTPGKGKGI